jgi:hypothetical protein
VVVNWVDLLCSHCIRLLKGKLVENSPKLCRKIA